MLTVALQSAEAEHHQAVLALLQQSGLAWTDLPKAAMRGFVVACDGECVIGTIGVER